MTKRLFIVPRKKHDKGIGTHCIGVYNAWEGAIPVESTHSDRERRTKAIQGWLADMKLLRVIIANFVDVNQYAGYSLYSYIAVACL